MPTWHSLLNEIKARGSTFDVVRRERLKTLAEVTRRNVITYYSGWLQKPTIPGTPVTSHSRAISFGHWIAFSHSPIRVGKYLAMDAE